MFRFLPSILVIAGGLFANVAWAQDPEATGFDFAAVSAGLRDPNFWSTLLATMVSGGLGGLVYELMVLQGNLELPHRPSQVEHREPLPYAVVEFMVDLGFIARLIIGSLAAVAVLVVLQPATLFSLLATSIVAGSAGISIFRSMQDRMLATLAAQETQKVRELADVQAAKVEEATQLIADLKQQPELEGMRTSAAPNLDALERVLMEARGVQAALQATTAPRGGASG